MIITPPNLSIFFTSVETRFWTAYGATPVIYQRLATVYPVATEQWVSGWIGMLDKAREWIGPRITRTPAPQTYVVPVQNFELTESIDQFKLEDDTYGIYNPVIDFMGVQMAKTPDYQLRDMLQNTGSQTGSRQLGLDGLSYFHTAHPVDYWDASKGTYPNDYVGGATVNGKTIGGGLAVNSFATVFEDMSRRKTESGEPWGIMPDLAVNGVMLKLTMDTILQAQFMGAPVIGNLGTQATTAGFPGGVAAVPNQFMVGATENIMKGWCDRLMWAELGGSTTVGGGTYDDVWYLWDTKKPVRGMSWLKRQDADFAFRVQPDDPIVFDLHAYAYGSKLRGAAAWGFAQLGSRSGP